ncbi:Protein phosphatase 2C 7 [Fusarium falciforme]|nr:Protein phosphatase 2C 7 [Fusarium falciforme]
MASCLRSKLYSTSADAPRFSYHIASSFIAKDRPYDPSTHVFHFNPYNRIQPPRNRRPSARPESGHDAFFVSRINDSGSVAFGVADGVGGWVDSGVDPADFSHGFCDHMAVAAHEHKAEADPPLTARKLMQKGYDAICEDRSLRAGGSTACVAIAGADGNLDVANLGDSGFLQLRLNAVHTYSEPQTHAFNTPFQLSLVPPSVAARMAALAVLIQLPEASEEKKERTLTLQSLLATEIVTAAKRASVNTKLDGPFAKEVHKYYPNENWHGGKVDDICVVVAVVNETSAGLKSKL